MSAFNLWRRVWIVAQRFARTLKPFVEISVPLALIWFAFRTDRVQDAQLEIAKTQADIARQRSRISKAANLAAFSGQVQRALDEQGAPTGHTLVRIRNEGAAFTQVHID